MSSWFRRRGAGSEIALVEASGLFDRDWYLGQRPGIAMQGLDPVEHYLRSGAALGLDPGPGFSGGRYLEAYPDVAAAGLNPLLHYLQHGRDEGRNCFPVGTAPSPQARDIQTISETALFDPIHYLQANPDVAAGGLDPLRHYVEHGAREGRSPHPFFDTRWYQARHMAEGDETNPLAHYARRSDAANVATSPRFDGRDHVARHPEAPDIGSTPLEDFLAHGLENGQPGTAASAGAAGLPRVADLRRVRCTVVVPVHDALDAVSSCLGSLFRNTSFGDADRLLLIDDASPDPRIASLLAAFADRPGVRVLTNAQNLGYTRTINRALAETGDDDVVLLNSDTLVGPNWLRRLKISAGRHDRIGTVTAVSNAAGEFSVPTAGNAPPPAGIDADTLARAVADSGATPFEVPTGNGFCLYLRRALVAAIGGFDEAEFPTGYGEENDFCMRAASAGWVNLVDPSVYVQHVRSASFGERREALAAAGYERVVARHPQYPGRIAAIGASPAFADARYRIARQFRRLAGGHRPKPRVMFVIATRIGGTPQTNADLMQALAGQYDALALCSDGQALEVLRVADGGYEVVERHPLSEPLRFASHGSLEYDLRVADILHRWNIGLLHVRHLAWHGLGLVDTARSLGIPVVMSFHDYYCVCPTVNLLDLDGRFHPRGVPQNAQNALWDQDPTALPMTADRLAAWQARMQQVLAGADAFVTTSESAARLVRDALPAVAARAEQFHVIPHGRDFESFGQGVQPVAIGPGRRLRVLLAGNLSSHKGAELVRQACGLDLGNHFEFHLLGQGVGDFPDQVVQHGPYRRAEFRARVDAIAPDIAAVLSIWPETWCHVLTECWAAGLPVLGVDIGAVGERLRQSGAGWLLEPPATGEALHARLTAIAADPEDRHRRQQEVHRWQQGEGRRQTTAWMAGRYAALYARLLGHAPGPAGRPGTTG